MTNTLHTVVISFPVTDSDLKRLLAKGERAMNERAEILQNAGHRVVRAELKHDEITADFWIENITTSDEHHNEVVDIIHTTEYRTVFTETMSVSEEVKPKEFA